MAAGLSGWASTRTPREGRAARVEAHAAVQRAEAAFSARQAELRTALASASSDVEAALAAMTEAEGALLSARLGWAEAAGITSTATEPVAEPVRVRRAAPALGRSVSWAKAGSAPRPSFTHGAWI
jgi:hypothetical protein